MGQWGGAGGAICEEHFCLAGAKWAFARRVVFFFGQLSQDNSGFRGTSDSVTKYAIDATPHNIHHTKHYTMNPKAAAMPASVGLKDSSSSSCVNNDTSVEPGRDLIA